MAWGRYQYFPVEIEIEGKKEAVGTVMEWEDRKNAVWTDGRVEAACVWWQKGGGGNRAQEDGTGRPDERKGGLGEVPPGKE